MCFGLEGEEVQIILPDSIGGYVSEPAEDFDEPEIYSEDASARFSEISTAPATSMTLKYQNIDNTHEKQYILNHRIFLHPFYFRIVVLYSRVQVDRWPLRLPY